MKYPRRLVIVGLVVAVATILVLATFAMLLYGQTTEDRKAKDRTQYVTIMDIVEVAPIVNTSVHMMTSGFSIYQVPNASWDNGTWAIDAGVRYAYGDASVGMLERISSEFESISVVYESDTERSEVFSNLSARLHMFIEAVEEGMHKLLSSNQSLSANYTSEMENASAALVQIGLLLRDGVEPDVDCLKHPYDVLAGVDLVQVDHYTDLMWSAALYAYRALAP